VRAGGTDEIELERVQPAQIETMRAGTSGLSADELVEAGMRALFLGEPLPPSLGMLDFMTDTDINRDDLREAFAQPNEIAEGITRLVVTEGLVGSGRAARIGSFTLGPAPAAHAESKSSGSTRAHTRTSSRRGGDSRATGAMGEELRARRKRHAQPG
jgi:hypothetical protein